MRLVVLALASFGAAELGQLALAESGAAPAFAPAVGVLLAALLLAEPRRWAVPLVTACAAMALSSVLHDRGMAYALGASLVRGIEAVLAASLMRRIAGVPFALDRLPHALTLLLAVAVVPAAGGLLAAIVPAISGAIPFAEQWRAWYLADMLGMMATAPLVVAMASATRADVLAYLRGTKAVEMAAVALGAVAIVAGVFANRFSIAFQVPAFLLPFIMWPALRFGPGASAFAVFVLAFVALWYSAQGMGPAAILGPAGALLRAQGGCALTGASLFLLATTVAERRRVARERDELVARLRQALAEIKTLRGLIPICAWCHKVRDDTGFWKGIEHYLDEHTDATFSHGICPVCVSEHESEIAEHEAASRAPVI